MQNTVELHKKHLHDVPNIKRKTLMRKNRMKRRNRTVRAMR